MRLILLLILIQTQDDKKKDLVASAEKMAEVKSYEFHLLAKNGTDTLEYSGEYADDTLHLVHKDGELLAGHGKRFSKSKDDKEWTEQHQIRRIRTTKVPAPHEWMKALVALTPSLEKERSDILNGVTVDTYVFDVDNAITQNAFKMSGMPGMADLFRLMDGTKTKNGLLFYVGRRDRLIYRVELRTDADVNDKHVTQSMLLDYRNFNKAKLKIPKEMQEKLGE